MRFQGFVGCNGRCRTLDKDLVNECNGQRMVQPNVRCRLGERALPLGECHPMTTLNSGELPAAGRSSRLPRSLE